MLFRGGLYKTGITSNINFEKVIFIINQINKSKFLSFFPDKNNHSVDGEWGEWSTFTKCTKTCGDGVMKRTRKCDSPSPSDGGRTCSGSSQSTEKCNSKKCPGILCFVSVFSEHLFNVESLHLLNIFFVNHTAVKFCALATFLPVL